MVEKKFVKGAIILAFGGVVCKLIGALYRIPLSNILGAEGIGIYQLIYPIYSFVIVLTTGGIASAEARLIARARSRGETYRAKQILFGGILIMLIAGILFSLFLCVFARQFSEFVGNELTQKGFTAISFAVLFSSIIAALRGYFQGLENMVPTAVSQVSEQVTKLFFSLLFAFLLLPRGVEFGVFGAMLGVLVSECLSMGITFMFFAKKKNIAPILKPQKKITIQQEMKEIVKLSFPIMIGSIVLPLTIVVDSFLVVNLLKNIGLSQTLSTSLFGIQSGMVNSIINAPTVISSALAVSLIPSISYSQSKNRKGELEEKTGLSLKISLIIILPCCLGVFLLSENIMRLLYPTLGSFLVQTAIDLMRVSSISILYITLMQTTTGVLQGLGLVKIPAISLIIACLIKIILTVVLVSVPSINIMGCAIASVCAYMVSSLINLYSLKRYVNFAIDGATIIKILYSTLVMAIIVASLNIVLLKYSSVLTATLICVLTGFVAYVFLSLGFGVVSKKEYLNFSKKLN